MKTLLFPIITTLLVVLTTNDLIAQPSDASILNKLKSMANGKVISIKLDGTPGGVRDEFENGRKVRNFYRSYISKSTTDYEDVTAVYRGMVKYGYRSGKWTYLQKLIGDTEYDGIPNPKWEDVEPLLRRNLSQTLGSSLYGSIVGEIDTMILAEKPNWKWHTPKSVEFNVTAVYNWKKSAVELEKVRNTFSVQLFADEVKGPWTNKIQHGRGTEESLSSQKYTAEELAKMKTLRDIDIERSANEWVSNLPDIEVPNYKNHVQMLLHFHELMMKGDTLEVEAYLRKTLSPGYFMEHMPGVPTQRGLEIILAVKSAAVLYGQQYCKDPKVKHNQSNMMEWYNKDASRHSRLASKDLGNGKRVITGISIYVYPNGQPEQDLLAKVSCGQGTSPLERMRKTDLKSFKGAYVFSKRGPGKWFYVGQLEGSSKLGYTIKWMDGSSNSTARVEDVCNYGLEVGDIVYTRDRYGQIVQYFVKENNGTTIIKIEDIYGTEASVHVKDIQVK